MANVQNVNGLNSGSAEGSVPKSLASLESVVEDVKMVSASVMMLLSDVFHVVLTDLDGKGKVLYEKTNAKTASMKQLESLRKDVQEWNETVIGDQLQIQITDEILLAGTKIPESAYSRCAYKLSPDGEIKFSNFPPETYEDYIDAGKTPSNGELVYVVRDKAYEVYVGRGATVNIYPPIQAKALPGPSVDFSAEEVGSIIFLELSKKYYRVAADGSGVEVTNYPLQKFIAVLSEKGTGDLDRALENRTTAVRDLSKKDSLDIQQITALVQVVVTAMIGLLSALNSLSNNLIRNI